jgi:benzoylformate decarboxylase
MGMADGYSRAIKRPSFVLLHSNVGTAHVIGNLINAQVDRSPVISFAVTKNSRLLSREGYTTSPSMIEMVKQNTKWSHQIIRTDAIPEVFCRAFKVAVTQPTGPVYIMTSEDVLTQKTKASIPRISNYHFSSRIKADPKEIERASRLMIKAESPIIIAGREIADSDGINDLAKLAEFLAAPVFSEPSLQSTSLNFPNDHPLYLGFFDPESDLVKNADIILSVGSRLFMEFNPPEKPVFRKKNKIIQINIDPWEIAKNYPIEVGIVADVKTGIRDLIQLSKSLITKKYSLKIKKRFRAIQNFKRQLESVKRIEIKNDWDQVPIKHWRLIKDVEAVIEKDAIIVDEAILASSYLTRYFQFKRENSYYKSSGGALGWGLPASLGVKLAFPKRQVILFVGDGSFLYSVQALWTASKYRIPVIFIIINNCSYLSPKLGLYLYGGKASEKGNLGFACDLDDPMIDFPKLAEAYKIQGETINKPNDIKPTLEKALKLNEPVLLNVLVDKKMTGYKFPKLP